MRCVLAILGLLVAGVSQASVTVTTREPGNVFVYGQRVVAHVAGGVAVTVSLAAYSGAAAPISAPGVDGVLNLGVLPQGYYTLEIRDGAELVRVPIAVVPKPRHTQASRIATDAAHAWLIPKEHFAEGAELLRRCGISWVRERLTWGEVEPARGKFQWGRYDAVADADVKRGLNVYQIFHSSPAWSRKDGATNRFPDDLRDVYRFAMVASRHYKGRVKAWEVWNEADIEGFTPETGADYAAFLKAAYLGFHAGDPAIKVTQVSFAMPTGAFADALYRNDTPSYFDIFNYHIYANVADYSGRAQVHFNALDRYHAPKAPVWLTEAGIALHAVNGTLTDDDRRRQAEFLPKSFATSLACGTDRHFFFVFPHYLENGVEFGLMDSEMLPYPGYSALAATVSLLGEARYLGTVPLGQPAIHALAFDNGNGTTVVAWREGTPGSVAVPGALRSAGVFNCVGARQVSAMAGDGMLELSESPVFLVTKKGAAVPVTARPLAARKHVPSRRYSTPMVVVRLRLPKDAAVKGRELYELSAGKPVPAMLEVYNFGKSRVSGAVSVTPPKGWMVSPARAQITVGTMGRWQTELSLTPAGTSLSRQEIRVAFRQGRGVSVARCVMDVAVSPESLTPLETEPIKASAEDFGLGISGNGRMIASAADSGAAFDIAFQGTGDRWAYPFLRFDPPQNWKRFNAIAMEIRCDCDDLDAIVRVQVAEVGGAAYYTESGWPASTKWKRIIVPFERLGYGTFSAPDPDGRLDLDRVEQLRVGVNTRRDHIRLQVRDVELLSLPR